jgi:tetratricopeptide (TPR) repeat protein
MFGFLRKKSATPAPAPGAETSTAADWRGQGNAALARGALDEAARCYRQAILVAPRDAAAHVNLGYVLLEQGQVAEAAALLAGAVALAGSEAGELADAHFLLARARQAQGNAGAALASYQAALAARPGFDEALQELVPLLIDMRRNDEALSCALAAAQAGPSPTRLLLAARALHAAGRRSEAMDAVESVLAREPHNVVALDARGNLLVELGRPQDAIASFEQVAALQAGDPDALANLAAALLRVGRAGEALACTEQALRARGNHPLALHAKGQALLQLLRVREAREFTASALALHPAHPDLRWNLAVGHLLLGDLTAGWEAHEARWQATGFGHHVPPAFLAAPRWSGQEHLRGKDILLFGEQGLGDTLQFLRYVPMVAAQAREVLLHVPPPVAPLAGPLAPNVRLLAPGDPLPAFDLQCPLLSLPHAFRTTLDAIPAAVPYLHADPQRVDAWRSRLPPDARPKVGIVWSGNPQHLNDYNRSIPLDVFKAIARPDVHFVNLQPQVREGDRAALSQWAGVFDAGPYLRDFAETAALVTALDLVITVDTSVAHLAGGLGRPVWILLPFSPDWRWMLQRQDTPWYPTARLYRQPEPGAWAAVLARVHADLQDLA